MPFRTEIMPAKPSAIGLHAYINGFRYLPATGLRLAHVEFLEGVVVVLSKDMLKELFS
jgi:hypothetical protein